MAVTPPRPKGPHLNALRAFEAAVRLGSFTAAAEELGVTPGAVAQHIKAIEAWTTAPLFERHARGIQPTALARALLPTFTLAFDHLGHAVHRLRTESRPSTLSIATLPSIAQLWLPRRLERLRAIRPDLTVSVTALETPPNLDREQFDLSVFFEDRPPGPADTVLARDRVFPVCSPALAAQLPDAAALARVTLLHDATWSHDWEHWLKASGSALQGVPRAQTYSLFAVALEEARRGAGVLISHEALVEQALAEGALVRPFGFVLDSERWLALHAGPGLRGRTLWAQVVAAFQSGATQAG
ncbi:MAG: LysR family transcriptional regulator [Rhodobacter sp.]|nr:LysR family transcriptional regulator [Paracoccaceae bacterium]MCC0077950.1 LysR family transcriptional regulator [Rhodobacter sp.]